MTARVFHADLYGTREDKYAVLAETDVSSTKWPEVRAERPLCLFAPLDAGVATAYQRGWPVTEAVPLKVLGFQSHRDGFAIAFEEREIERRLRDMADVTLNDEDLGRRYRLADNRDWKLSRARATVRGFAAAEAVATRCHYRPFDWRWCHFGEATMDYPRRELLTHVAGRANMCLNITRQTKARDWRHCVVARTPTPALFVEVKDGSTVFPLYLYAPAEPDGSLFAAQAASSARTPNLAPAFIGEFARLLGMELLPDGRGDRAATFGPEDVFSYIYAVLYSPTYRERYAEFLKIDFPRIPLTSKPELFRALASLGDDLVALHLMESPALENLITEYLGGDVPEVEKVTWSDDTVWLDKARTIGFRGVPEEVWNFHIGGYQVCSKWLKDRKGRTLTAEDIAHYQKIVVALSETIRIMAGIDEVIEAHGGWPGAFATSGAGESEA